MSSIATSMQAWRVPAAGEPEQVMALQELPVPQPGPGQVLVEVWAGALNFADVLLVRGQYQERPALPFTPGLELCGVIVATGAGVSPHRVGERVIGTVTLGHGALARYAVCAASDVFEAPPGLDDVHAGALHIAYQTAWFGLYRRASLRVGEHVLVHAAAGGVGSAAVQLAVAAGAKVIGVVGSPAKAEAARRLGCHHVVDRSTTDVREAVLHATGGRGVEVVFDPVGGEAFEVSSRVIAFEGRIVLVGFAGGSIPTPGLNHALVKNYSILGLHWGLYRTRSPELVARCHADLSRLASARAVLPLVSEQLRLADAVDGLRRLGEGSTIGRLVVVQG
ncbi:MAG: NADPH:quinone oxidoreductase family protein [Kineosporiaceae bacterium]|nr:NADPH:quinone oxidoreductase family protein [Kineosporiaceae bacterium]